MAEPSRKDRRQDLRPIALSSTALTQPGEPRAQALGHGVLGQEGRDQVHDEEGQPASHEAAHQHPKCLGGLGLRPAEGRHPGAACAHSGVLDNKPKIEITPKNLKVRLFYSPRTLVTGFMKRK